MSYISKTKNTLKSKIVGIAGAGGLGSNCACALVRSGIEKLIIADFDTVSQDNLHRQFYFASQVGMKKTDALKENLLKINRNIDIETFPIKITPENVLEIFGKCDIVVEALDDASQKQWFIESITAEAPNIPLIAASGIAGSGNIETLKVERYGNLYICGDQKCEVSAEMPPLAPRVTIVAMMEADTVIEILKRKDNEE